MIDDYDFYMKNIAQLLGAGREFVAKGDKTSFRKALRHMKQANALLGVVMQSVRDATMADPPTVEKKNK